MKNTKRKGFTIVELVIVIAVIAILAAVLIPTFASLVKKANQSADIQAVKQMNTQLAITEAEGKPGTIGAAVLALNEVNINIDDYTPLITGRQFYWVKSENRVIYVNLEDNKILYPEQYEDLTHKLGDWYSLNGDIEFEDYGTVSDGAVSIGTPGQFAKLVDDYNKGGTDANSVTKITLSSDIDLAGATVKFIAKGESDGFSKTIEIDGNNKTIYGLRDDTQTIFGSGDYAEKAYGYGLFGNIAESANVTIRNVTFDGMNVQDTKSEDTGTAGLLAGYIYGTLTLEKVIFNDCSVTANQAVGAIVGQLHGTLNMTNIEFTNTTISGGCEVAKLVGRVCSKSSGENVTGGTLSVSGTNKLDDITTVSLVDTFKKDAFTVKCGGNDLTLKGDSNNTFKYVPDWKGDTSSVYVGVWNVTTDDWAWYRIGSEESTWNGVNAATYKGKTCFLNGTSFSASTNFINGNPATN